MADQEPAIPHGTTGSLRLSKPASRPQLLSKATTAVSRTDVHTTGTFGTNSLQSPSASRGPSRRPSLAQSGHIAGTAQSETDDSASVKSHLPDFGPGVDTESLVGDVVADTTSPAWKALSAQVERSDTFDQALPSGEVDEVTLKSEFENFDQSSAGERDEEALLSSWRSKLKHFFVLSASGKPIYSRHGDDRLVSHYIGIVQTIISSYQSSDISLKSFTANGVRFVVLAKGPINLVAISRLSESEVHLRTQLEALYMQILSTLTLPGMERIFANRPSTDLRRPLEGTDVLLDGLADGFTKGSPSTLLSALECLRMRKTQRRLVDDALLKSRSGSLLYGLIVADGRLVSVVRPKKHSLHPGDLHLIFNMLFEAGSVKAGGGENWIPLCLPGFNNTGFVYMYVSFLSTSENSSISESERPMSAGKDDELAIILISANKEAFFELRKMRDELIDQLHQIAMMTVIKTAIRKGHSSCSEIIPGTALQHFLYKSKANVQFAMPSFGPHFQDMTSKRRLLSLYHDLHEAMHSRTAHLKVQHTISQTATAISWQTPAFELFCVAGPHASRASLAQGANRVVQWIRREEERVFIIGGAVF